MATKKKMLQAAAGNAGGGAGLDITDVFSTYLYEGNGSTQTITNGIDLSGEGGLVWTKNRSTAIQHFLFDTTRSSVLATNNTNAAGNGYVPTYFDFNSNGFFMDATGASYNDNNEEYASWTFRKAPKFFTCVQYTGNGVADRTISHDLNCDIGVCIIKRTDSTGDWWTWHRSLPDLENMRLNSVNAQGGYGAFHEAGMTSTTFGVDTYSTSTNINNATYVAYLFAHNDGDGEFGPDGDQDIIKCGSYTGVGSGAVDVDLGFEPQLVLTKNASRSADWMIQDTMRGMGLNSWHPIVVNKSETELSTTINRVVPTATGFTVNNNGGNDMGQSGDTVIYMAIRRGPLAVPEDATEVFDVDTRTSGLPSFKAPFAVDMGLVRKGITSAGGVYNANRLTGTKFLYTNGTDAEANDNGFVWDFMDGWANDGGTSSTVISWMWKRAPGFFDAVAYRGNSTSGHQIPHNLNVPPELIIVKNRNYAQEWPVSVQSISKRGELNTSTAFVNDTIFVGDADKVTINTTSWFAANNSSYNYIMYLFASAPGVSKVGSYTGNGSSQTIDCGFTSGARFVLIKRTDSSGDWNVYDTARGIVTGNDSRLSLNTTDAEDTSNDRVDPNSSGFTVNYIATGTSDSNISGATYIFYAIA